LADSAGGRDERLGLLSAPREVDTVLLETGGVQLAALHDRLPEVVGALFRL
jgi:hypothetical protein